MMDTVLYSQGQSRQGTLCSSLQPGTATAAAHILVHHVCICCYRNYPLIVIATFRSFDLAAVCRSLLSLRLLYRRAGARNFLLCAPVNPPCTLVLHVLWRRQSQPRTTFKCAREHRTLYPTFKPEAYLVFARFDAVVIKVLRRSVSPIESES